MKPFFRWFGGRKIAIGLVGCALLTWGASQVDPFPFGQYGQWIVALLLGVAGTAAYEDGQKHRASPGHWRTDGSTNLGQQEQDK